MADAGHKTLKAEHRPGRYMRTADGKHWVCLETTIEHYEQLRRGGDELAAGAVRFFKSMLALAQESRPS